MTVDFCIVKCGTRFRANAHWSEDIKLNVIIKTIQTAMLAFLRGYKWAFSPLLPPSCRYVPTCSEYAAEAVERYGSLRGSAMSLWRVLRCHPFVRGGYDPVPWNSSASNCGASLRPTGEGARPHMP